MEKSQEQEDAEWVEYHDKEAQKRMKRSAADRDFTVACVNAKKWAIENGLRPTRDEGGELQYTPKQGFKAACHGREDTCAILQIQFPILERLDSVSGLLKLCLLVLAYIAYRVS